MIREEKTNRETAENISSSTYTNTDKCTDPKTTTTGNTYRVGQKKEAR